VNHDHDKLSIFGRCGDEQHDVELELATQEERAIAEAVERFIAAALQGDDPHRSQMAPMGPNRGLR